MTTLASSRAWRFFGSVCVAVLIVAAPRPASAATRTLAWDANAETDIAGYRLSYGTAPGSYATTVDVGKVTQWTISGLSAGVTYYFVIRAYNTAGLVSAPSNPVNDTIQIVAQTGRLTYDSTTGTWSQPMVDEAGNTPAAVPGWTVQRADFNGDGTTDLFLYNRVTGVWLKAVDNREGTYSFYGYQWAPGWTPFVADMDGDGRSDVFIYNKTNGQWFRCLTTGSGDFSYTPGVWAAGWTVAPGDYNGDRRADLFLYNNNAASDPNSGKWFRVLSIPGGLFSYVAGDARWASDWQLTPADFNGDGRTDMFLYRSNGQWFRVFFADTGTQYSPGVWAGGWTISAGKFNSDPRTDLFLYNASNGQWFVTTTNASSEFEYVSGLWAPSWQITPADFNRDGRTDLLLYNTTSGNWFEATTVQTGVFGFTTGTATAGTNLLVIR